MHQIKAEWLMFHIMYVTQLFYFGTYDSIWMTTKMVNKGEKLNEDITKYHLKEYIAQYRTYWMTKKMDNQREKCNTWTIV